MCVGLLLMLLFLGLSGVRAQIGLPSNGTLPSNIGGRGGSGSTSSRTGMPGQNPFGNDSSSSQIDTSATKGLIYHTEIPDSILRQKVFMFHHRTASVWIDEVHNPSLDPTGAQFHDALDALNGNYYLGKGSLGHPHIAIFPTPASTLQLRLQPDAFAGYAMRMDNIGFYQTLTPFSLLSYGGSLAKDHQLRLLHTQNILPGWNAAFEYRLLNPEGVYASSGAVNHMINASTNYFSPDSRLQMSAAIISHSFNIDENGGLANDNIFIQRLQSNRAGIPVNLNGAGTLVRNLEAMGRMSYSLERQSELLHHRDSLVLRQVNDSITRFDTLDLVDTIPLRHPSIINAGIVGLELDYSRRKRVFTDSTQWREQWATLFWTNDAYADHRWLNPLKITLGLQSRYVRAVVATDTLRAYAWLNPFARAELTLGSVKAHLSAEMLQTADLPLDDGNRLRAALSWAFDSAQATLLSLEAVSQSEAPYLLYTQMATLPTSTKLLNIDTRRLTIGFKHRQLLSLSLSASQIEHHTWVDTSLFIHQGSTPFWLLQTQVDLQMHAGPIHLDMQQMVQHSTDASQLPLPLWMSKNSLYADFYLFSGLLHAQAGTDIRYHTPYHAPLYHPKSGLFLQQDRIEVGGYVWADVFVNIQVKRATIYLKAGHINALWETPATYFMLPHYPGQRFGLLWGLTWCFFD